MIAAAEFTRRVTFQQRANDANGDPVDDWNDIVSRSAKIQPLKLTNVKTAETVIDQRLQGNQPVVIYVRRDTTTKAIDNTYRAVDARNPEIIWAISSAIWNEPENIMEFLAVQRRNGSDV